MESIVAGFLIASLVRLGGLASTNHATSEAWAVALVYGVPIGAGAVALLMMVRLAKPHASLGLSDRLLDLAGPLISHLKGLRQRAAGLGGHS
jgi:hypothetical protein